MRYVVSPVKMREAIHGFLAAFEGRSDIRGADDCGRGHPGPVRCARDDEWERAAHDHLLGVAGMGVYPMMDDHVLWGCVDFDEGEIQSREHAQNLHIALAHFGVTGWVERSRSKGYHVWVFASEWVPARLMRRALLGACESVDAPMKEINPKSEELDPDEVGNFVRLPFFGALDGPVERQVILNPVTWRPVSLVQFLQSMQRDATPEHLTAMGSTWRRHVPVRERRWGDLADHRPWMDKLSPRARTYVHGGPSAERDRSGYLMATANAMAADLTLDEMIEALRHVDEMHCRKFCDRRDAERRYTEMAEKAVSWILLEGAR